MKATKMALEEFAYEIRFKLPKCSTKRDENEVYRECEAFAKKLNKKLRLERRKKHTKRPAEKRAVKRVDNRLRTYVVWLSNHTDHRDDEVIRVKARSHDEAGKSALGYRNNFSIRSVMTLKEWGNGNWV